MASTSTGTGTGTATPPSSKATMSESPVSLADLEASLPAITATAEGKTPLRAVGLEPNEDEDEDEDRDEDRDSDAEADEQQLGLALDPRCRVVVVSASINAARAFVDSVIALSGGDPAQDKDAETEPSTPTSASAAAAQSEPVMIPHTLTNRYYTARVHFAVYTCAGLARALGGEMGKAGAEEEGDMPLFKSEVGEGGPDVGFKREFEAGFGEEGGGDSEMRRAPGVVYVWADGEGDYKKELAGVVRGMERAGWEAEVCLAVRVGGGGAREDEEDVDGVVMEHGFEYVDARDEGGDNGDVGRLPRVVDALSTVMWVSMESKGKGKTQSTAAEREGMMRELLDVVVSHAEDVVASPVEMERDMLTPFGRVGALSRKVSLGFEDEFVPGGYRTLGSVSDFGGSEGYVELEEEWEDGVEEVDADWDEPTQEEIEETAGRLFGGFRKASEGVDLGAVLESLQAVKGEIAGLGDGERRKMAARVALGLAYGLDIE